jgi:hypothetical protein
MTDHATNTIAVGLALLHAILSAAHLTRRNHLHRTGDLLRVLHAADLIFNLFADGHVLSFQAAEIANRNA